jgi:TolB-like protein/Flp pilus assembly protein TadD/DNA-binding winged helix-turn-helix (wHTH) protein
MDADGLQNGFIAGGWLIEPRRSRATSPDGQSVELSTEQAQVLVALAARHGEAVDRRTLRNQVWPGQPGSDEKLRTTIAALRAMFGDRPRHPRYIAAVGHEAFALIAHFEPAPNPQESPAQPAPEPAVTQPPPNRLYWLLGESRRRSVFKVAASYLFGMWIMLQVAEVTFAPLKFPDWWMTALTILAVLGLPIVVALAWTYEITPAGIVLDLGERTGSVKLARRRQTIAPAIVLGVALMSGVTGLAWWRSIDSRSALEAAPAAPEPGAHSIAVLPLTDMSPAGGNSYLGDGLTEELSTRLAQVPGLRVAARTSAFEFKGKNIDVRRIGQSLGVRHVLEGSVRRIGNTVRVTVQLIDARTGYHVWAGNFDREWSSVLELQDDVARSVSEALQLVLEDTGEPAQGQARVHPDTRAIDPYLEGLALLRQPGDPSVVLKAEQAFRAAIAITPGFAGAHAGLCRALLGRFDHTRDRAALREAEPECQKALNIDATLLDTRKALAELYVSDGRYPAAINAYTQLLKRNPQDADAQIGMGEALASLGRTSEAEASLRRAVEVEPGYWASHAALGDFLFERGRIDEAVAELGTVTELVPSSAAAWSNLGGVLQMKGDMNAATRAYERSLQLEPSKNAYSNLATSQYYAGRFSEAVRNFDRALTLGEHDQVIRGNLADALWQVPDRRGEAIEHYRRAIEMAETELASTPNDATLQAQLGYYYGRVGEVARSRAYLDSAVAAAPDMLYVQYYRAVAAADRGDRESALVGIAELLRLGFDPILLRLAPEFRSLQQDPDFLKLMDK